MASTFEIPTVTPVSPSPVPNPTNKQTNMLQQDLSNFHKAHLSLDIHQHFTRTFLQPQPQVSESPLQHEPEHPSEEEEDDLGYYPDGTKRTLTSAQVDMFRFSEIQSLLSSAPFLFRYKVLCSHDLGKRRRAAAKKQAAKDRRAQRNEEAQLIDEDILMLASTRAAEEGEITELDRMKSRLQAAVWASSHEWDNQASEERAVPRVIETVDVGTGKNFLWPAIEKGDW